MIVSISLTVLLAILSAVLIRGRRVSLPTAAVLWLSGFTLASTGIAGPVNTFLTAIAGLITHH
ncbi:hypothetical protein [Kitasatospora sp. MBT63]|uniref:hypothetical protein n=1 Tax=Kitasatospora sp. MBT63 TaxID=1444768 RepID=UPI0006896318|nr:hypothetical protein [Kitasatospora sp. MBT63]